MTKIFFRHFNKTIPFPFPHDTAKRISIIRHTATDRNKSPKRTVQIPQHLGTFDGVSFIRVTTSRVRSREHCPSSRRVEIHAYQKTHDKTNERTSRSTRVRGAEWRASFECASYSLVSPTPLSELRVERESTVGLSRDSPPPLPAWWPMPLPACSQQPSCCASPAAPTPPSRQTVLLRASSAPLQRGGGRHPMRSYAACVYFGLSTAVGSRPRESRMRFSRITDACDVIIEVSGTPLACEIAAWGSNSENFDYYYLEVIKSQKEKAFFNVNLKLTSMIFIPIIFYRLSILHSLWL